MRAVPTRGLGEHPGYDYRWRWAKCQDPNRPSVPRGRHVIRHPLADRKGQRCKVTTRSPTNGNMRVEFPDGFWAIAPRHAVAKIPAGERTLYL